MIKSYILFLYFVVIGAEDESNASVIRRGAHDAEHAEPHSRVNVCKPEPHLIAK